jgi:hypothetical protein
MLTVFYKARLLNRSFYNVDFSHDRYLLTKKDPEPGSVPARGLYVIPAGELLEFIIPVIEHRIPGLICHGSEDPKIVTAPDRESLLPCLDLEIQVIQADISVILGFILRGSSFLFSASTIGFGHIVQYKSDIRRAV